MKHIVIPTDYSENAFNAYVFAINLATQAKFDITAVHTYELPIIDSRAPRSVAESIIETEMQDQELLRQKELAKMRSKAAEAGLEGQPCDLIVRSGEIVEEVCNVVEECGASLVVLGTKGASGLREVFLGSNAAKIIAEATSPVLVIPENATFKGIKKIAYFTNFDEYDITVLERVIAFGRPFNAEIHLVHVDFSKDENNTANLQTLAEAVKGMSDLPVYTELISKEDLLDGMLEHIHKHATDVVAMLTHRKGFIAKLFSVSHTRETAFHTEIPLLSFRKD
ncbi:universal stress protein [Sphingobacteriales bacterium UPWRP_1]|nr:hypothetical protein BVG80_02085 [Sphingobacteriales bacterium TSM_CSM]PSJ75150.1 universal stress protein [Sphingobacteriales bacterium UPWRP_1]